MRDLRRPTLSLLAPAGAWLRRRLAWSGPLLTTAGEPGHRVAMARTSSYLYLTGAVISALPLAVVGSAVENVLGLAAVSAAAALVGAVHVAVFDRLPWWGFQVSALSASAIVSAGIYFAGAQAGASYALFYLWVALYAFFFFRPLEAVLQLAFLGASYVTLLVAGGGELYPLNGAITIGSIGVAGWIVLLLKRRLLRLVAELRAEAGRHEALAAMHRRSQAEFVDFVQGLDAIVWEGDAAGTGLSFVSRRAEEILGYPVERWLEDSTFWLDRVHPDDRDRVDRHWQSSVAAGGDHEFEYRMIAADGRAAWFRDSVRLTRDERGHPLRLRGVMVDVTERKEAEERLLHAQKMEAVGQLAGGIAHDFNNLLTAINGYSDLALARLNGTGGPVAGQIGEIRRAGERAAALTRQLLAFSRRQVLETQTVDLNEVVRELDDMLRRLIGEDVEIVTALDPALRPTTADVGQLQQVLVNLAVNARDAMPDGGTLTITSRNRLVEERPYAVLSVADSGGGMDAETAARVFEPFFTTKEPGKGTGLGLATVYGIVAQSGGFVTVESDPGAGSTFSIHLPHAESLEPAGESAAPEGQPPRGAESILVVEDEDVVRALVAEILETQGYEVVAVETAEEALERCRARRFDLLLTDVVMPGVNGRELAGQIAGDLPVLFMSGYPMEVITGRGLLEPGTRFLQKPFTPDELARAVRETLDAAPERPAVARAPRGSGRAPTR